MADPNRSDGSEKVRDAVERSRSGAPAAGAVIRDRFSADEVFQRIVAAADEELTSGKRELLFSAIAAGFAISITVLLTANLTATTNEHPVLSALLYPLGFIYIIIGGYQLYTENTLPPVALTLERLASIPSLFRHWSIVLTGNFIGGVIGAAVLAWGGVFSPEAATAAIHLGEHGVETPWWSVFFKATFAGLIVAGVVWVEYATQDTISRVVVVYLAFLAIPIGNLFHVVTSFTEMFYVVFAGELSVVTGMIEFVLPVLLGNTIGGITLVTVVNYFQTSERRLDSIRLEGTDRQLSIREWMLGGLAGQSYVPVIDTTGSLVFEDSNYRLLVPIANPRTESRLVDLACTLASQKESAVVHVVHIVQTPSHISHQYHAGQHHQIVDESDRLLENVREQISQYDVEYETSTVVSPRSFEEIFSIAKRNQTDLVVMEWGNNQLWNAARTDRPLNELTSQLSCDFLVFRNRGYDTSRILLPIAGGPDSDLSGEIARTLQSTVGSEITLLHIVDGAENRDAGEQFISNWAAEHELQDATITVDDSGDVEAAIGREATNHTMLIIGSIERGLLSRLVTSTLYFDVIDEIDCSVLLVERPTKRSLFRRLFQ
ncbi:formate/nitrite transporter family protein [Halalkalicoccus ordinarius]|uniref:formate/nitrite transporter family protein n=1 Tax=Halalkalicoccus ordinarius TaxID=3116651 RepID=UPI00300F6866